MLHVYDKLGCLGVRRGLNKLFHCCDGFNRVNYLHIVDKEIKEYWNI